MAKNKNQIQRKYISIF